MQQNTRDTGRRRLSAYFWGALLILSAAVLGLFLFPFFSMERPDLVDQEQEFGNLYTVLKEVHEKQAETLESYQYNQEKAAEGLLDKLVK